MAQNKFTRRLPTIWRPDVSGTRKNARVPALTKAGAGKYHPVLEDALNAPATFAESAWPAPNIDGNSFKHPDVLYGGHDWSYPRNTSFNKSNQPVIPDSKMRLDRIGDSDTARLQ
ncbi:unnamed protein product [Ectocarpus sp. 12 AP-2014]